MSNQGEGQSAYRSYLLRLWHTHSGGAPVWRAALENPLTQEVVRFDSLPDLIAFLRAQTGQGGHSDDLREDSPSIEGRDGSANSDPAATRGSQQHGGEHVGAAL